MEAQREVSQRDLRTRSKEIMDAVERGDSFTVTRDGHRIGELIPLRRRRRFVPRAEFVRGSQRASRIDLAAFRADQDASLSQEPMGPSENRRVVAATVEDADNHHHLVEDGEGDDHSATKADRPQTWPNVVTGFASVRGEGQLLAEGDDRIRVTVGGFR